MFYYTFTTFDCNFIPRNAEICKVSSKTKNVGKAHKYRLNRHLPTYEKIIKNLYSFSFKIIDYLIYSIYKTPTINSVRCFVYLYLFLLYLMSAIRTYFQNQKYRNAKYRKYHCDLRNPKTPKTYSSPLN